ncbi:hypothetical protein BKK52_07225 [Rodentibacter trehalosifermentans]|uniref:Uncharacterized protein n=1 Tax=Rodentibacter trehalosifermentans TaxID=1908263 RepID=A0A1V3IZT6_9PAST|nr:hypothetical protein BKK52_07225 [Rodentibacter trehalosifermentans]
MSRVFYCQNKAVFVPYLLNSAPVYYIKPPYNTKAKTIFPLDFSDTFTQEKSQANLRHARTLNVWISTQITILNKAFTDIAPFRSFYLDPSTQNNAEKRRFLDSLLNN